MKQLKEGSNLKKRLIKLIKKFTRNQFHWNIFGGVQYFIQEKKLIVKNIMVILKNQKLKIVLKTF